MADEMSIISNATGAIWSGILTVGLTVMSYFARKLNADIEDNAKAAEANVKAISALELKVAENYATKPTVMALFQEATTQTKEAVARVEKSIDTTNLSVGKLDTKIDKVVESIGAMQQTVLHELSKKT